MLTEAIRLYLVSLGVTDAAEWTHDQIMCYLNEHLMEQLADGEGTFRTELSIMFSEIQTNLLTVSKVLNKDLDT
jgi:precorrin isomerase